MERSKPGPAKRTAVPNNGEKSKRARVPLVVLPRVLPKDDGMEQGLPESVLSTLPTGIVIKPCPGTSSTDEEMDKGDVNTGHDEDLHEDIDQEDCKEGNPDEAAEEPIAGTSDGALTGLQALIAKHTRPTDDDGHFCIICSKGLSPGSVKGHFEDLHWSGAPSYYCPAPKCQKVYTAKSAFRSHLRRNHPDWKGVPLDAFLQATEEPIAGTSDAAPTSLQALITEKTWPTDAGGHFCKFCLKVLGKGSARRHFEDRHWSEGPSYHCPAPECQKAYTSKSAFKMHLRTKHPDLKGVPLETLRNIG